jgi:hypothetical protein
VRRRSLCFRDWRRRGESACALNRRTRALFTTLASVMRHPYRRTVACWHTLGWKLVDYSPCSTWNCDHMAVLHGVFASITGRVAVVRRLCTGFAMLPVVEAFERIPRRFAGFDNERRESDGIAVN